MTVSRQFVFMGGVKRLARCVSRTEFQCRRSPGPEGGPVVTVMSEEVTVRVEETREDAATFRWLAASRLGLRHWRTLVAFPARPERGEAAQRRADCQSSVTDMRMSPCLRTYLPRRVQSPRRGCRPK